MHTVNTSPHAMRIAHPSLFPCHNPVFPCQGAWRAATNVGMDWELAAPLAPKDGFYNERYRCTTMASFDMGDPDEFEKLFCGDEEAPTSPNPSPSPSPSPNPSPEPEREPEPEPGAAG